jgi:hypothetical protein
VLLGACFGSEAHVFPEGLEPLEDNLAAEPGIGELTTESGNARPSWGHGRARYAASSGEVWIALKDPTTLVNTWATDRQNVETEFDPNYEFSFVVNYTVDDLVKVQWAEEFRYGTIEGPPEAPGLGMIRYQMVYGSEFIDLIEGSYQVLAIDETTTEVQMVQHVQALSGGHEDIVDTFEHIHAGLLTRFPQ